MQLFEMYGSASGQWLNSAESHFYTGNTTISLNKVIKVSWVSIVVWVFPFFKGVHKSRFLRLIADNIKNKLSYWKGKLLSMMGRIQSISSIIIGVIHCNFQ
ncbi:hypothetical protein VIGAN_09072300, partial [Vigna angularis var. angularis]